MNHTEFFKILNTESFKGAYFLHGEEEFVKEAAVERACSIIPKDMRAFNLTVLFNAGVERIIECCETLPVFTEKSVVILRETPSAAADVTRLIEYFDNMPETTVLLIVKKGKADERSALLKYFIKNKRDVVFNALEESDIIKWCMKTAVQKGVVLEKESARTLVGLVGNDMTTVSNELQKAIDYVGPGGKITAEAISKTAVSNIEFKLFTTLDCFTAGKVKDGMKGLHGLLTEDRDAPLSIAGFLESRFKLMLQGKLLMEKGRLAPRSAAAKMEGRSYANEKACKAASKYSIDQLAGLVKDFSLVNYSRITAGEDPIAAIEKIMISFNW